MNQAASTAQRARLAALALCTASENYIDGRTFSEAVAIWTADLDRNGLVRLVSTLGAMVGAAAEGRLDVSRRRIAALAAEVAAKDAGR